MNQCLMISLVQAAHACCQSAHEADQMPNLIFIATPQSLLLLCPDLIYQTAQQFLDRLLISLAPRWANYTASHCSKASYTVCMRLS